MPPAFVVVLGRSRSSFLSSSRLTVSPQLCRSFQPLVSQQVARSVYHASAAPSAPPISSKSTPSASEGIRVNKCFKSFASRRESDKFIESGRVTINAVRARSGDRVHPGDIVCLDDREIAWERLTIDVDTTDFVYIKHWKRPDVVCTTDPDIPNNIVNEIILPDSQTMTASTDRIFPIGRLDEPSTGVILLTSDGRLPNRVLGAGANSVKEYLVMPDMYVTDEHVQEMREGVTITTVAQRDGNVRKPRTARTLPCEVERRDGFELFIRLKEGRNRQIRKMLGGLGYTTRNIHRVTFMGITLDGLSRPGDSKYLDDDEMTLIKAKLKDQ